MRYIVNKSTGELKEENAAVSLDIIAPEEETAVASRAYTEGEQFILEGKLYAATAAIASGASIVTEGAGANAEEAPNVIKQIETHTPAVMTGASSSADGTAGLAPQPHAGDQDKVLQGNGSWGKKLQFDVVIRDGKYGYINGNNEFVSFKSQADIDAAVTAAKVGTATAAQVLTGYTFTNNSTSGLTGSMVNNGAVSPSGLNCGGSYTIPAGYHNGSGVVIANSLASQTGVDSGKTAVTADAILSGYQGWVNGSKITGSMANHQTNSMIVPRWGTGPGSNVPATQVATRNPRVDFGNTTTYGSAEMIEVAMPSGLYSWSYGNSSLCIPTETKTVTAGTSASTVTPTEYNTSGKYVKFLKSVTVNPTPSQEKTVTGSRSAQTVTPDSGKLLSKVTVNKYPDASGTYTTSTRGTAVDMGESNNYRYVNTDGVSNTNSGTYTMGTASTGATYDMGATNTYRYINATNVYNKGKSDAALKETTLWTNSAPTTTYIGKPVTLSQSMLNFSYIKFTYRLYITSDIINSIIVSVNDFKQMSNNNETNHFLFGGRYTTSNGWKVMTRRVNYAKSTSVEFSGSYGYNKVEHDDGCLIPQTIIGMK